MSHPDRPTEVIDASGTPAFPGSGVRGHYESYYLRAVDPAAPRAVWIRHTVLRRPGGAPAGSLWCTVWDAAAGPPVAVKSTPGLAVAGDWLEIAGARFGPAAVSGRATAGPHSAEWDLTVTEPVPPLRHLPHPRLYRSPLPRTKLESPAPAARRLSGTVEADGRRLELGRLARDDRAQLGLAARRALALAARDRLRRSAGRVARRCGRPRARSARRRRPGSRTARSTPTAAATCSAGCGRARRSTRGRERRR